MIINHTIDTSEIKNFTQIDLMEWLDKNKIELNIDVEFSYIKKKSKFKWFDEKNIKETKYICYLTKTINKVKYMLYFKSPYVFSYTYDQYFLGYDLTEMLDKLLKHTNREAYLIKADKATNYSINAEDIKTKLIFEPNCVLDMDYIIKCVNLSLAQNEYLIPKLDKRYAKNYVYKYEPIKFPNIMKVKKLK